MPPIPMLSTHSQRVERWLGAEQSEALSRAMTDWYGPPIPLIGVPGNVYARGGRGGGDFVGPIAGGALGSILDFAEQRARASLRRTARRQLRTANMGFASLGDLISEATTGGKKRTFNYNKVGTAGGAAATSVSLWAVGNQPVAGAIGAAAPGGTAHAKSDTGALPFNNPGGGDTQHLTRIDSFSSLASATLMLYDRLFSVARNMNSTGAESVTGVPTRYTSTSQGADYAGGNFIFCECITVLAATAHNWDDIRYTDQDGNTGAVVPSFAGISACAANRLDMPTSYWFAPLASGDHGLTAITQIKTSAAVATGTCDVVMGRPLGIIAHPVANMMATLDGITGAFNLNRIMDNACLAFMDIVKPATTATTFVGSFETVSG
jgi:hypothetical protein